MKNLFGWKIIIALCLTIGLAPFFPEPHIVGKIRWVLGGAHGMGMVDWFDLAFHGFPWVLALIKSAFSFSKIVQTKN